jgi:FkbM family methyltransferase
MLKNLYHKPWVQKLRTLARAAGIVRLINKLRSGNNIYEQQFDSALQKAVKPGDVVWDIGANVGLYTKKFMNWTGDRGKVVAFEPFPKAFAELGKELLSHTHFLHAVLKNIALSNKCGEAFFSSPPDDAISTTAHLADDSSNGDGIKVSVSTADEVMQAGERQPNVVKIDVEGYEEEVLQGGSLTFSSRDCRHILVEMHFARMAERKLGNCASRIAALLTGWGYTIEWVDASHIHAYRM